MADSDDVNSGFNFISDDEAIHKDGHDSVSNNTIIAGFDKSVLSFPKLESLNLGLIEDQDEQLSIDGCFGKSPKKSTKLDTTTKNETHQSIQVFPPAANNAVKYPLLNVSFGDIQGNNNIIVLGENLNPNLFNHLKETNQNGINVNMNLPTNGPAAKKEKIPIGVPKGLISDIVCRQVSKITSGNWMELGSYLGLSQNDIDTLNLDHNHSRERCYQMLILWREKKGMEATYEKLGRGLLKCNRSDVVKRLQEFKKMESQ